MGGRTLSHTERVEGDERVEELAAMLDGYPVTAAARASAQDLANRAEGWKAKSHAHSHAAVPAAD